MEKAFADPWPAGFLLPKAKGSGVCGRMLLARMSPLFSSAQAEPSVLEGQDLGQPEKGPVGKWASAKTWLESN